MGLLVSGKNPAALKTAQRFSFVATAGQTVFTIPNGYSVGDIDVYMNGIRLVDAEDYIASDGTTLTLVYPATVGDHIHVMFFNQFAVGGSYTKTESDSRYMTSGGGTPMTGYLKTPNYGISSTSDTQSASLEASSLGSGTQGVGIKAWGRSMSTSGGEMTYVTDTRGASGQHIFYGWNGTSLTKFLGLDTAGRMTLPYQPSFHVNGLNTLTNQSVAVYPTIRYNVGNHYNNTNGRFTAPITGTYMFGWTAIGGTANDTYRWRFQVNGTNVGDIHLRQDTSGTGSEYATNGMFTIPWKLNAGEYVNIFYQSDGSTLPYGNGSVGDDYLRFWGYLLG